MTAPSSTKIGDIVLYKFSQGNNSVQRPGIVTGINDDGSVNMRVFVDPKQDGSFLDGLILIRGSACFYNVKKGGEVGSWMTS